MTANIYVQGSTGGTNFTPLSVLGVAQLAAPVLRSKASKESGPRTRGKYYWVDNGSFKKAVIFVPEGTGWEDTITPTLVNPMRVMVEMKTEADEVSLVIGMVSVLRLMGGTNIVLREVKSDGVLGTFIEFEEYVTNHGGSYHGLDLLTMGSRLVS